MKIFNMINLLTDVTLNLFKISKISSSDAKKLFVLYGIDNFFFIVFKSCILLQCN